MSRPQTKWNCGLCGKPIYWDELFTFMSNKAVVHYTCFKEKASSTSKVDKDVMKVILDSLEDELNKIVVYKQRLSKVNDEEIKKVLDQTEKDAEKNAALFTRLVEKMSNVLG
ncbi:DUF2175 domain-containing protein [Sulfolobus acidocaldarius]|uniref:DUF2175 domain-containing protein n=4 Tax=Sulfolobus acidocaldarius TaxID=2285 RepID=Q4J6F1_SULAC|nr:DUF2175 domain-containing protein [Sulfolobus acidocaldarius]AAY81630.1 hypothetical protein Saci_2348 [Sulfolobus acidocaldarius DSM 639]AGE72233.1 hypothetical protein SacN8_11445 [Sulfolobus acidocaldarius N8]AGE74550.1 hypothetical protein SacRon12I_11690 [Sulfolobus acidocaldarius Ron12/I]ALU29601.1 hypothetical protein ATY89_06370 [Sulfolobus acidocaldarius]ALU32334.1 hypothetical protein ATZ20_09395 [Sulfolobus acidocaldarius]